MGKIIFRLLVILSIAVAQLSLLAPVMGSDTASHLMLFFLISWVAVSGFEVVWPWAVVAGITTDAILFYPAGLSMLLFVIALYGVSFFSRRFFFENKVLGGLALFLIAVFSAFVCDLSIAVAVSMQTSHAANFSFMDFSSGYFHFWAEVLFSNVVLFGMAFWLTLKTEKYLGYFDKKIQIKKI